MLRPSYATEGRLVREQERPFRDSEVNKTTGSQTVDTRDAILNGTLPVSQEDAIMLAGIQCQIQFGDHDKHKHKPGLFETKDFLPKEYCEVKGIEKKIFLEHKKWAGYSEHIAKVKYTQQCRTLKTYGYTFFLVKEEVKGKSKLVPILLGINKGGIIRVDEKTKKIMKTWPLTTVKRYSASLDGFTLDFGDYADKYYSVKTQEGEEISVLISGYIDTTLRQKAEEKSWHTLRTSEKKVQAKESGKKKNWKRNLEKSLKIPLRSSSSRVDRITPAPQSVRMFGSPLEDCTPSPNIEFVPLVVDLCTQIIEARGLEKLGIYRISGNQGAVNLLQKEFSKGIESMNWDHEKWSDVIVISTLLKSFFRQLPEPLIPTDSYQPFIDANSIEDPERRMLNLKRLIHELPEHHFETLKHLAKHLKKVAQYGDINRMDAKNLAMVFGSTLIRKAYDNIVAMVKEMSDHCEIIKSIILHYEWFFSSLENDSYVPTGDDAMECVSLVSTITPSTKDDPDATIENLMSKMRLACANVNPNGLRVPEELLTPRDVDLYLKAIKEGKERDKLVRVMVVGHYAQGKTSLTKRLFGQSVEGVESTNGIEVHSKRCFENGSHWKSKPSVEHIDDMTSRLVNVATQLLGTEEQDSGDMSDITGNSNRLVEDSTEPMAEEDSAISLDSNENSAILLDSKKDSATALDVVSKEVSAISFDYKKDNAISLSSKKDGAVSLDSKYDKDMVTKFAQKLNANKTLDTAIMDHDKAVDINVWDFGGQFVFYATHQIFHSKSAIYLLVFNLKESFDSMLIDEDFPNNKYTLKSCLTFWMESIHSFVGSDDGKEPTVILVGTHKGDCCGKESEQLEAAMDIICETKTINHVYPTQFATECMDPRDESFEQLRNAIYKLGLQKTQHRMIPAKWIPLEKEMLEIRNRKIVRLVDILKIDSENSHPIQDEEQVKLFLKYHHEKGSLIFFDEERLHEFIVLDPQFLIDAFKCIITSRRFYRWKPSLKDLGDKLMTSGILELKLLEEIWGNDETNQFSVFQDVLLAFMERLRILAEMKDVTEAAGVGHVERCFLVPSLLKGQADERVIDAFLPPCKKKSNISLVLGLEKSSILPLVYQRVMAAVLAKWPPVYFPKTDPLLYRDIGVFLLNYQHAGLIAVSSGGLEMTVINLCLTSPADATVCDQFRRYVEKVVLFEFGKFSSGSEKDIYKYYIRCNHSDHGHKGSLNMHELEQVMGYQEVHCPDYGNHVVNMRESVDQWFKKDTLLSDDTVPDRELTDKDLSKIAQAIGKNWKLLGIDLGLGQDDIEQCEIDNITSGVKTTIYYILKEWRKRYPEQNSLKVLIKQMKECEDLTVNWDKINNLIDNF